MLGGLLAFAPIIDSNQSIRAYRVAAGVGNITWKLATVPGEFRRQALASDLVIVRSRHEHERVAGGLGIDPAKIEIVLNGVDPVTDADPAAARRAFDLPENFLLHVSSYTQDRKNVVRMLEAVGPLGIPVILVGHTLPGPTLDHINGLAERFGNVRRLPFVDQQMLHNLYAACRVFCLPSTHEGTGLVALEAASLGARIVITRNGGPPDYFANLAEYVDPFSVESIRSAVQRAWEAPPSDALRTHVLRHLTWDASARALMAAYAKHRRTV
jgi:glycosyltransferase involved in cell wall biosynthesis